MTAKPFAPEFLAFDSVSPVAGSGLGTLLNLLLLGIPTGLLVLALLWDQQGMGWVAVLLLLGLAGWWGRPFWIRVGRGLWHQVRTWPGSLWMVLALSLALIGGMSLSGVFSGVGSLSWEAIGALGEVFGAAGQILIAILAAYIAWRQYIISRDLTIQQNVITQQQTIDAYFEGISGLVLAPDGQLDDWPLERAIAAGRTAALLNGVDRFGKAKILRFLSTANLLSPLRRDDHLGRPILDGKGGYQRDRLHGIRVVNLETMLEGADLHGTQLRAIDLSEASLEGADLRDCDLSHANLCGANLRHADLRGADLYRALLFVGSLETASPAQPGQKPDFKSGAYAGAVVAGADFRQVRRLSPEQRAYLATWGAQLSPELPLQVLHKNPDPNPSASEPPGPIG
ncbi:pentapeptide repeat-containing protein [Thermostichus vulcanus]|uniref:Pentapeptide repeat-containing protein n=1 Tax=Thermostichus vulcanus str. 'Rupite' TaxID=2813851 RepID=A0ABT0CCL1_THEVL|nr:pentapeptide repeat-containing protein [Thermostichus vulcanus]MCJ2543464.1 pentapeptide repeat-containing protein [Thermostichus vulcanus str. 'Rupite']